MPSDTDKIRKACRAVGRVQGVGFRVFIRNSAKILGVTGWAKNMEDGSVTMELQGEPQTLETLIAKIKKDRNRIKVTGFEVEDIPVVEGENIFAIRY